MIKKSKKFFAICILLLFTLSLIYYYLLNVYTIPKMPRTNSLNDQFIISNVNEIAVNKSGYHIAKLYHIVERVKHYFNEFYSGIYLYKLDSETSEKVTPTFTRLFALINVLSRQILLLNNSHNDIEEQHYIALLHIQRSAIEIYYFLHKHILTQDSTFINTLKLIEIIAILREYTINIDQQQNQLELLQFATHIQDTLHRLQNPTDCARAPLLICDLSSKSCGLGCLIHHISYCLTIATASNRTMLLENDGYSPAFRRSYAAGWSAFFKPVTSCNYCQQVLNRMAISRQFAFTDGVDQMLLAVRPIPIYRNSTQSDRIVWLPIRWLMNPPPIHTPLLVPEAYDKFLRVHHTNPPAWLQGQFIKFFWKFDGQIDTFVNDSLNKIPFEKGPIVGIHVRRSDKLLEEANFHGLDEYMFWVELWFTIEERMRNDKLLRRIYIATDDQTVIMEAQKRYGRKAGYEIYFSETVEKAKSWWMLPNFSRYSAADGRGIIADVEILTHCSYVVCTFSSNVCRLVYELMQALYGNAGDRVQSIDDLYEIHYEQQHGYRMEITESYNTSIIEDLSVIKGDEIEIVQYFLDGYSNGTNLRTGKIGLIPTHLLKHRWKTAQFHIFDQ